ncbi:MAG TPA: RodZ domain-containing protein [Bryobacteraceae bacterium]|nr:RodZ domain-containing protein [Bryobacteraceae bacterium]
MMFSVGQRLREARLDQGLDFDTLVTRTKIQEKFLKAIEADDRKSFPSGFFYKSFVDQYARALSIDAREIDEEINRLLSDEAPLPLPGEGDAPLPIRKVAPMADRRGRMRALTSAATLVVVLVGCSGFYAWWRNLETPLAEPWPVKAQAVTKSAPVTEPAPLPPQDPPPPVSSEPAALPVSLNAPPANAPSADQPTAGAAQPISDASEPASGILLELVAREETWLAVSSDGMMIFKGTLSAHESKTVEGKEFAKLRVNNPAALEVKLNGKALGPLGRPGQFVVVVFTRDKFHVLDSAKESD